MSKAYYDKPASTLSKRCFGRKISLKRYIGNADAVPFIKIKKIYSVGKSYYKMIGYTYARWDDGSVSCIGGVAILLKRKSDSHFGYIAEKMSMKIL